MSKLAEELHAKMPHLTTPLRLRALAFEHLKRADKKAGVAHDGFMAVIKAEPALLFELFDLTEISRRVFEYLWDARADMVRFGPAQQMDGEKGQEAGDTHMACAPPPPTPLPGEGQKAVDNQKLAAQPRQPHEGGGGHLQHDFQAKVASPPSPHDSRWGHARCDAPVQVAPSAVIPKPIPLPKRGVSAMAAIQGIMAKNIVFRLHDGRDIMDAHFHELAKIEAYGVRKATQFAREAMVAKYLRENVTYANPDPFARIGDLYPQKMIDLAIQYADTKEPAHV